MALLSYFVVMLGGVEAKDVLSLSGAWVDGSQMFAALHFPDRGNYSVLLDRVIGNLFGVRFRRGLVRRRSSRALAYFGFVFRHQTEQLSNLVSGILCAGDCCTSSRPTQRHLHCLTRNNNAPALPFHFDT